MQSLKNKTVLITGSTGLIGSNLVHKLMQEDSINIIVNGRNQKKITEIFAKYLNKPNFKYLIQDISEKLDLDKYDIDFIFHAASPQENKIIQNEPLAVILPNIVGLKNCLDFIKRQKELKNLSARLILFSSVTIYGNNTNDNLTVTEKDTNITNFLHSTNAPYSESKRLSEVLATSYVKQFDLDIIIARISTVYGNTYFKTETAFFEFLNKALSGNKIVINNSNVPKRDNIYIDDCISGLICLAEKGISGEAYNISSNNELNNFASIIDIANTMKKVLIELGDICELKSVDVIYPSNSSNELIPGLLLDNTKLKSLGWSIETSLYTGIKKTILNNL